MRVLLRVSPRHPEAKEDYRDLWECGWRRPASVWRASLPQSRRELLPETGNHCRQDCGIPICQTSGANTPQPRLSTRVAVLRDGVLSDLPQARRCHLHAHARCIHSRAFRTGTGLQVFWPPHPAPLPRMQFLFVRPALLPSDPASRRGPLPSANRPPVGPSAPRIKVSFRRRRRWRRRRLLRYRAAGSCGAPACAFRFVRCKHDGVLLPRGRGDGCTDALRSECTRFPTVVSGA